jgi:hypothetical protein
MPVVNSHFRELFRIFRQRLIETEDGSEFNTRLWQTLGILAVPGLYASGTLFGVLLEGDAGPLWMLRSIRTFFTAYSFCVSAFVTLFEWDMLFPDRRDFLVLTQFPIRLRDLFAAKLASLGMLLGVLIATVNIGAVAIMTLVLLMAERAHNWRFVASVAAYMICTTAASVFGFLIVAALQGVLINLTPVRLFRRLSPYVQMAGMSVIIIAFVLFPLYVNVRFAERFHPEWFSRFPPYWFAAMQELFTGRTHDGFREAGVVGLKVFAFTLLLWAITWAAGFARHYERTLESEDSIAGRVRHSFSWTDRLLSTPQERGIYRFTGAILARSNKHRMFLACYWSLGLALGLIAGLVPGLHGISFSEYGVRGLPFLLTFFTVSGLRVVFQFPAELNANWLFQIAEADWGRAARKATRLRILASGLIPALLLFLPLEIAYWGSAGLLHIFLQGLSGLLLAEAMFWTFDKVPFTCSYFPGRMNLALLVVLYLYGFTTYSFRMADIEQWIEMNPLRGAVLIVVAIAAFCLIWRWKTDTEMIRFDGSEPDIQILDLS